MIQFITHTTERYDTLEGARMALKGGCRWIQFRMKNASEAELYMNAMQLKEMCDSYGATLIINDRVNLCMELNADGVHLGKEDMDVAAAREILGENKVIGATANSFEDIKRLAEKGADYIGLGPFRFTRTKEKLSPVLGTEGYREILSRCKEHGIAIPVVAIGGILEEDLEELKKCGVRGIAVSSVVLEAEQPVEKMERLILKMQ